jgi:hypothetical protein
VSISEPQGRTRETADLRLVGVGTRPESDPSLRRSSLAQRGQQRLGAAGDVAHGLRVDAAIEPHGLHGSSGNGESSAALQDIRVALAKDRRAGARLQVVANQVAPHREGTGQPPRRAGARDRATPGAGGKHG